MPKVNISFDESTWYYFTEGKREKGEYVAGISDEDLSFLRSTAKNYEKAQDMLGELLKEARTHIRRNSLITKHYPKEVNRDP